MADYFRNPLASAKWRELIQYAMYWVKHKYIEMLLITIITEKPSMKSDAFMYFQQLKVTFPANHIQQPTGYSLFVRTDLQIRWFNCHSNCAPNFGCQGKRKQLSLSVHTAPSWADAPSCTGILEKLVSAIRCEWKMRMWPQNGSSREGLTPGTADSSECPEKKVHCSPSCWFLQPRQWAAQKRWHLWKTGRSDHVVSTCLFFLP